MGKGLVYVLPEPRTQILRVINEWIVEGRLGLKAVNRSEVLGVLGQLHYEAHRFRIIQIGAGLENRHQMRVLDVQIPALKEPISAGDEFGHAVRLGNFPFHSGDRFLQA